jgi:uncharacterized membrane protein
MVSKMLHRPLFMVGVIALIYVCVTVFITLLIHNSFNTYAFDLGAFTQTLKYTLEGKMLWHPSVGGSELSQHFSPVLFFLVPFYWLFPHAQTLLIAQAVILGFSGYLVYLLAREYGFSHRTGLLVEALFFINPLVWGVALFDFHPVAFAVPGLLAMFLGMKQRKAWLFGVGLFVALISREDAVITAGIMGAVLLAAAWWKQRRLDRYGAILLVSAVLTYGVAVGVSALNSHGDSPRILSYLTNRYTYVDGSKDSFFFSLLKTFFSSGSLFLVCGYLVPLGFLPLLSYWSIPGLFILLSGMLSTSIGQHDQLMQYTAPAIPYLFVAFIAGLKRLEGDPQVNAFLARAGGRMRGYAVALIVIAAISMVSVGRIDNAQFPDSHDVALEKVLAAVPDGAVVTASNQVFPHICSRTETYLPHLQDRATGILHGIWGYPEKETEYVVVDRYHRQDYIGGYWEDAARKTIDIKYDLILQVESARLYRLKDSGNGR